MSDLEKFLMNNPVNADFYADCILDIAEIKSNSDYAKKVQFRKYVKSALAARKHKILALSLSWTNSNYGLEWCKLFNYYEKNSGENN